MNEFFKNLRQEAQQIKLSQNEKQSMRFALRSVMNQTPAPAREVVYTRVRSTYAWYSFISSPRFALPVAIVLLVGLGSGTAFAAQGSLPGDALYPIKVNVTEPVQVALATTPAAKSQVEADIADRRVVEAQTLAAQGRLDATTTQELEDNFDEHASQALAFASEEATTSATTSVSVSITSTTSIPTGEDSSQGGSGEENNSPRVAAFSVTSVSTQATSSGEVTATTSTAQSAKSSLSASLQKQRNILNSLKARVNQRGRGGRGGGQNDGQSTTTTNTTTTSATVEASTTLQTSTDAQVSPGSSGENNSSGKEGDSNDGNDGDNGAGSNSSGDQNKNQSGGDSIIPTVLNNF